MNSYQEFLPKAWVELIEKEKAVQELFSEFSSEEDPVPPFLFQDFRGGNLKCLRPIFALYGKPGLTLLEQLNEIDRLSQDTAQLKLEDGRIAYAGYFFTRPKVEEDAARAAAKEYIEAVNRIYEEEFQEAPPLDSDAVIEFPNPEESAAIRNELHKAWVHGIELPEIDIRESLGDWFCNLTYQDNCGELADFLSEPLYHINNDYFLSYYLQWPLRAGTKGENPFLPHYKLWCMGLEIRFPARSRVVLLR